MKKIAVILCFLYASSANSETVMKYSHVIGQGLSSCGQWNEDKNSEISDISDRSYAMDQSWVMGYLSGIGAMGFSRHIDPLEGVDHAGVVGFIDNYCSTHPIFTLRDAAIELLKEHPNDPNLHQQ